jgi:hypothetical protein
MDLISACDGRYIKNAPRPKERTALSGLRPCGNSDCLDDANSHRAQLCHYVFSPAARTLYFMRCMETFLTTTGRASDLAIGGNALKGGLASLQQPAWNVSRELPACATPRPRLTSRYDSEREDGSLVREAIEPWPNRPAVSGQGAHATPGLSCPATPWMENAHRPVRRKKTFHGLYGRWVRPSLVSRRRLLTSQRLRENVR